MKVKASLRSLGEKIPQTAQPVTPKKGKSVERFTEATFTSNQFPELKEYAEQGKKCRLVFEGEVSGFSSANEWDIRDGRMKKGDVNVTIKFLSGSIEEMGNGKSKPKSITEAGHMVRDEAKKKS